MKQLLIVLIFFIAACNSNDKQASSESPVADSNINGDVLFKANCVSCHKPDKDFTGPALKGSLERWGGDKKAMYAFIRNPSGYVVENAYAKQLYEKWNKTIMPASALTDAELDAIMKYCEDPIQ